MTEHNPNWGEIRPVYGRWVWPFRHMKPGDWFTVAHVDRDPEAVRKMVSVRSAQLWKRFSVTKDWQPGVLRVDCIEGGAKDVLGDLLAAEEVERIMSS